MSNIELKLINKILDTITVMWNKNKVIVNTAQSFQLIIAKDNFPSMLQF